MKKLFLSLTLASAFFAFTSCSSDDDSSSSSECKVCDLELLGQATTTEYCNNGDGTVTVITMGTEQSVDLEGMSFSDFIAGIETLGATCN